MELQTAIEYALMGEAILFLGSGASVGATNQNNQPFPIGRELADRLYQGCSDLSQAAELFCDDRESENKDGKQELINFLKTQFRAKTISDYQAQIPSVPWKRIYTTNYDNIVEKAYYESGKYIRSLATDDSAHKYLSSGDTIYLHINGSIEKLNKETLNNQFKLTDFSYNTSAFNSNEWGKLFANDLNTYSVVIFIGFSMTYDLDIRRIVSTINKDKCIFIVHNDESENTIRTLKKYGNVECIGCDGFFKRVSDVKADFDYDISTKTIPLSNFEEINNHPVVRIPDDSEVLTYYKVGKKTNELYYEEDGKYKAIVKRNAVGKILNDIENGTEAIFIHADIGNGKTEAVEQICYLLSSKYSIYKLRDNNEKIASEIEHICQSTDKKIVVIENFFNYYDVLELFKLFNSNKNITFIFTARTSIFKSRYEQFSFEKTSVHDLNRLDDDEINDLVKIFEEYGYYPKERMDNTYYHFIKKNYNSKLQAVVLGIFENEAIANSLALISNDIRLLNKKSQNILLLMITSKVMNLDLNFTDVLDLLTLKSIDYDFAKNHSVNELINFKGPSTSIKSVTICTWMIKNLKMNFNILDILVNCACQADIGYKVNKKYEIFLGNIISYKHLKFILNLLGKNRIEKLQLINDFYQKLKNLNYYKNKYFFWLQYGISALELNDLEAAEHHFNAALKKIYGETIPFEINNQYARLKMEVMLTEGYKYNSLSYQEIVEINDLLTPTSSKEDDEFYCYKMSSSYYPKIFSKFYHAMSESEKEGLKKIAYSNYNLCLKYMLKNCNDSFVKNVKDFLGVFEYLSQYPDDVVKFHVERITGCFAKGKAIIDGEEKPAVIHISQISHKHITKIENHLTVGQVVEAKIIKFNKIYNVWELSCKLIKQPLLC